ncbi:hypothetical protein Leryth_021100 [Lithospermum erythrorhizon]|nr:hypothetical protein Leryth_021100 [Lithospermum erythrorhizon]
MLATSPSPPLRTTERAHLLHLLSQCTTVNHLKQLHAHTLRTLPPHHPHSLFIFSKILHFASLKDLNYTSKLFNQIQQPNSFTYNTLIRAYAHSNNKKEQAVLLFKDVLVKGSLVAPDKHTYPFVLKACAYLFALSEGRQVHAHVLKHGLGSDVYVNNSLVHFYGSCGCLKEAMQVFDEMTERSKVSWNVIIDALVQLGEFDEALQRFSEMGELFEADGYTMQSVISACAGVGALYMGMWAHAYVLRNCNYDAKIYVLLNNCLISMYCKCGSWVMAVQVFEGMSTRDLNSWNSMILGFAMHGEVDFAFKYFDKMIDEEHLMPNSITFVGVLSACSHRGLVSEGRYYFDKMVSEFKIKPVLEHFGCLVDLLARAGRIDEALDVLSTMEMKPDAVIWRSILNALCKRNAGVELSEEVARQVIESEGNVCSGVYVLLSRVYACAHKWNEVGQVRKLMDDKGITKEPGCSSIEVDGVVHEFFAGDTSHPRREEIYKFLDIVQEKLNLEGYAPDSTQAPMVDEHDGGKGNCLKLHSERFAIAFGLLNSKPGVPIRVFKNLSICNDCHNVAKLLSKIFNVDIIVRDRIRFHHFTNGSCTCMDYW